MYRNPSLNKSNCCNIPQSKFVLAKELYVNDLHTCAPFNFQTSNEQISAQRLWSWHNGLLLGVNSKGLDKLLILVCLIRWNRSSVDMI